MVRWSRTNPGMGASRGLLERWSHAVCTPSERCCPFHNRHFSVPTTTGQLVQSPGSWAEGGFLSKTQQRAFAERRVTNVLVRDLDLHPINNLDSRRLEVVVDGLSLFRGAQLAINTIGEPSVSKWDGPSTLCHHELSCHGACQNQEGKTLPGARGGPWEGSACRLGGRDFQ